MDIDPNTVDQTDRPAPVDAAELLHAAKQPPVNLNVRLDLDTGLVRLDFSQPTSSVSMDTEAARSMAKALREAANEADQRRGGRSFIPNNLDRGRGKGRRNW